MHFLFWSPEERVEKREGMKITKRNTQNHWPHKYLESCTGSICTVLIQITSLHQGTLRGKKRQRRRRWQWTRRGGHNWGKKCSGFRGSAKKLCSFRRTVQGCRIWSYRCLKTRNIESDCSYDLSKIGKVATYSLTLPFFTYPVNPYASPARMAT